MLFSGSSKFSMTFCWYLSRSLREAIAFHWTILYHFHITAPMDMAVLSTAFIQKGKPFIPFSLDLKLELMEHFRD